MLLDMLLLASCVASCDSGNPKWLVMHQSNCALRCTNFMKHPPASPTTAPAAYHSTGGIRVLWDAAAVLVSVLCFLLKGFTASSNGMSVLLCSR